MRICTFLLASFACLWLGALRLPAGTADLGVEIHRIEVEKFPRVSVGLTLLDRTGSVLKGLERQNFRLFEAGLRVKLEEVEVDRTPIVAAICLDSSGSMTASIDSVKRAAGLFIRLLDENDQAELIAFADDPRLISPRTGDKAVLLGRLHTMVAFGATALYDGVWKALMDLEAQRGKRVIVLLTDGQDQNRDGTAKLSRHGLREVLARAKELAIPIYCIGLGRRVLKDELKAVARVTGGRAYFAPRPADLEEIYRQIAALVKSQVTLTYRSPNVVYDGKWRPVEVRASVEDRQGSSRELYRAPGKYVLELNGQGYDRLRVTELEHELPSVRVYDTDLLSVIEGKPSDLLGWLLRYFQRAVGEKSAPAPAPGGEASVPGGAPASAVSTAAAAPSSAPSAP